MVENAYLESKNTGLSTVTAVRKLHRHENVTLAAQLSGSDKSFTIVGGEDQELFKLEAIQVGDESFGVLNFKERPNFEQANDYGADKTYKVNIRSNEVATIDGSETEIGVIQEVTINVKDINERPEFLDSPINQDATEKHLYKVSEATTTVTTLLASDPDAADQNALSFRIVDDSSATEAGAGLFQIDTATGELSLVNPPDYEALQENGNWIFDLTVEVTDYGGPGIELDADGEAVTLTERRYIQVEIVDVDLPDVEFLDPLTAFLGSCWN